MNGYQSSLPVEPVNDQEPPQSPIQVQIQLPQVKPVVSYILVGITVFFFILQLISKALYGGADYPAALGAKVNQFIEAGEIWRLVTPVFFHGSILHIILNMYALIILGPGLERFYGHFRFTLLYFCGALTGNVASYLMSPNISLGASTAIFALILAQAVFVFQNRKYFGARARSMLMNMGFIVVLNLVLGLSPGIDNWGHVGGLLGGAYFPGLPVPFWK